MFVRTEWVSNVQTQSFFLRLCLKQRSKIQQESDDVIDADDEDDHLIEASASDVEEECFREARNTVMDEIGLKHPVLFDIYDVCSLARDARLPSLKVKMLRDMCKHFLARNQNARYKCSTSCKNGGNDFGVQLLCNLVMTSTRYANAISFFTRTLQTYEQRLLCRQM